MPEEEQSGESASSVDFKLEGWSEPIDPKIEQIDTVIEQWWNEVFRGSVLAQNTNLLNFTRVCVDNLRKRLKDEFAK